jgi:hypothetical protein
MNAISMLNSLSLQRNREHYPDLQESERPTPQFSDNSPEELKRCIIALVELYGGYATEGNRSEIFRHKSGKQPSVKNFKGNAIHVCESGLHLTVEVETSSLETKRKIERAGGRYFHAKDFQSFFEYYQSLMAHNEMERAVTNG